MKIFLSKINLPSLLMGFAIGILAGLYLFSLLVPSGLDMIRVYHLQKYKNMENGTIDIINK